MTKNWTSKPTMSILQYSQIMGISRSLAYKLAREGKIPGLFKVGERRLVIATLAVKRTLEAAISSE